MACAVRPGGRPRRDDRRLAHSIRTPRPNRSEGARVENPPVETSPQKKIRTYFLRLPTPSWRGEGEDRVQKRLCLFCRSSRTLPSKRRLQRSSSSTAHSFTEPSAQPAAMVRPSGEQATLKTSPLVANV